MEALAPIGGRRYLMEKNKMNQRYLRIDSKAQEGGVESIRFLDNERNSTK